MNWLAETFKFMHLLLYSVIIKFIHVQVVTLNLSVELVSGDGQEADEVVAPVCRCTYNNLYTQVHV